jgi:hypothetical protein
MTFGTILRKSAILTSIALILRDLAGIGSAPYYDNLKDTICLSHMTDNGMISPFT